VSYQPISTQPTGIRKGYAYLTEKITIAELHQWASDYLQSKAKHSQDPSAIVAALVGKLCVDILSDIQSEFEAMVARPDLAPEIAEAMARRVQAWVKIYGGAPARG
jgi:hypothetical protein